MPFTAYKSIGSVLQDYQIVSSEASMVMDRPLEISAAFREELKFSLREFVFDNSEYAVCENLIYPVLREVYKPYRKSLTLWSHQPLNVDSTLCGVPDYVVAKRSPLGKYIFENPYLIVVEAKRDDFIEGWGQCLAEMVAAQKLNSLPNASIFGIVTNGKLWEFGQLAQDTFIQHLSAYTIYNIEQLLAGLNFVFGQCAQLIQVGSL